jgi:hypothetical protein
MFKKRNDAGDARTGANGFGTKGFLCGTTAGGPAGRPEIRPDERVLTKFVGAKTRLRAQNEGGMKQRLLLIAALLLPVWLLPDVNCSSRAAAPAASSPKGVEPAGAPPATPTPQPDLFAATVRPILLERCAPCHEPGGKMYERLPFDNADAVAAHSSGVLKRMKTPDERAAVEKWLASQPKG